MMLSLNKIHTMDCLDGMRQLDANLIDVIVTSPPYNIGVNYSRYNDKIPRHEYLSFMEHVAVESYNVLDKHGSFYLNIGGTLQDPWLPYDVANMFRKYYVLQNVIHWVKSISIPSNDSFMSVGHYKPINSSRYHHNGHEYIYHFTKTGEVPIDKLANGVPYQDKSNISRWGNENRPDLRDRGNIWFIPYTTITKARDHPAPYPVELPKMCIRDHGVNKTNIVLDPFMGIGTTAVACRELGVDFIGFEIDENYTKLAMDRLR